MSRQVSVHLRLQFAVIVQCVIAFIWNFSYRTRNELSWKYPSRKSSEFSKR